MGLRGPAGRLGVFRALKFNNVSLGGGRAAGGFSRAKRDLSQLPTSN